MDFSIGLLLLGLVLIIGTFLSNKTNSSYTNLEDVSPYVSKPPLTLTEAIFYHRLSEALPEFIVLAQVQLSSFIKVDSAEVGWENFNKWFNPISQQSVDFLVCDKNFSIITAIELDDKSHNRIKSIELDNKKNNNLAAASVPLIRWHAEQMPDIQTIKQAVSKYSHNQNKLISREPEWLVDESPRFLKKQKSLINSFVANVFVWCAIVLIIMACFNIVKGFMASLNNKPLHRPAYLINQTLKDNEINKSERLEMEQKRQEMLLEHEKTEANQARLEMIRQQNEEKLRQAQESALKEQAWESYSRKSVECTSRNDIVTCGNMYIRQRAEFEKYWEAQYKGSKY